MWVKVSNSWWGTLPFSNLLEIYRMGLSSAFAVKASKWSAVSGFGVVVGSWEIWGAISSCGVEVILEEVCCVQLLV